jgi:hypothetical protein
MKLRPSAQVGGIPEADDLMPWIVCQGARDVPELAGKVLVDKKKAGHRGEMLTWIKAGNESFQ